MSTIEIIIVVFSVLATLVTIWITTVFVRRKNPPKINSTEEKKAEVEHLRPDEMDDPLN